MPSALLEAEDYLMLKCLYPIGCFIYCYNQYTVMFSLLNISVHFQCDLYLFHQAPSSFYQLYTLLTLAYSFIQKIIDMTP